MALASGAREARDRIPIDRGTSVSVALAWPSGFRRGQTPALVLAPGAGSDLEGPLIAFLAREFAQSHLTVRFNFPYRERGRSAPDPQRVLEVTYRAVLAWLRDHRRLAPGAIAIGGKSMGGRIASHLAAGDEAVFGLVLLGYPLHPPGRPDRLRDAHLPAIRVPTLFVQGSRDPLCRLDLLRPVLDRLTAPYSLHVVEDGDHSFKVRKRTGRSETEVLHAIRDQVAAFLGVRGGPSTGRDQGSRVTL
jgi:predicted alpha/beta-hydrolase family hydrolase